MKKYLLLLAFLISGHVWAVGQVRYLTRSPYALLMGDAFTAKADDNYTLFYNPAALSKNGGVEFYLVNFKLGLTNVISDLDKFSSLSSDPSELTADLTGFPIYIAASGVPTLKFGPFGLTLFASFNSSMTLRNSVHPYLDVDHRYDRGFIMGYAHTLGQGGMFKRGKKTGGASTTIGLSVKHMNREGVKKGYDIFGTSLLSKITSGAVSDYGSFKTALGYSKGDAWGWDIGVDQTFSTGNSSLNFSLVASDVMDTDFTITSGTNPLPSQKMIVSSGVSYQYKMALLDFSVNMDFKPVLADVPFARKLHFGFDFGIPMIRAMIGFNEGYLSYGARINLWPFVLTAGFYGVELGNEYRQLKGSRLIIYLSLLDFSFDA